MSPRTVWSVSLLAIFSPASPAIGEFVPFDDDRWTFQAEEYDIVSYEGRQALYLKNGLAYIDDLKITDGVIEFDIAFDEQRGFSGALWRMTDSDNFEEFYLRHHQSGNPDANQYTPIFNSSAAWQLYHGEGYAEPVTYRFNEWMHIRIVYSGSRAEVYIDSDTRSISIPDLKHLARPGNVGVMSSFAPAYFSNFSARHFESELTDAPNERRPDSAEGLITAWQVSRPFRNAEIENMVHLDARFIDSQEWEVLESESNGITNLSELAGIAGGRDTLFARAFVESESRQKTRLRFGYSDNAKVFVNRSLIYEGTNRYRSRDYRYLGTIGLFDAIYLDLEPGINEIVFAIQEDFGGWGVMAQLDDGSAVTQIAQVAGAPGQTVVSTSLARTLDDRLTERAAVEGFTGSVLVSRGGEIVLDRTYGPTSATSSQSELAYWIASATKQFTGALIATLAHEGALDLDARIGQYLDDVPLDKQSITIRQLLTHSSGLGQRYAAEGIADRNVALQSILDSRLVGRPGEAYSYSNDGFTLLAIIAEVVTGESYEDLMQSRLLDVTGMADTGFWGFEEESIASVPASDALTNQIDTIYSDGRSRANWGYRGATGMYSTTRDLHAWLARVMKSRREGDSPLSRILNPELFVREVDGIGAVHYGFGLAVVEQDGEFNSVSHIGDDDWLGHNSTVSAFADGDVIVVLSNAGYHEDGAPWSAEVVGDIREILQK